MNSTESNLLKTDQGYEDKVLDELLYWVSDSSGNSKCTLIEAIAGLDNARSWLLRDQFKENGKNLEALSRGLAGIDSPRADDMREELLVIGIPIEDVLRGLAGVSGDRWMDFRFQCFREKKGIRALGKSLIGVDRVNSWELRKQLLDDGIDTHGVLMSLAGIESKKAEKIRQFSLEKKIDLDACALGLSGIIGERGNLFRQKLLLAGARPEYVLHSLILDDSDWAWTMRKEWVEKDIDLNWIALGMAGILSSRARSFRENLLERNCSKKSVALGVNGDYLTAGVRALVRLKTT